MKPLGCSLHSGTVVRQCCQRRPLIPAASCPARIRLYRRQAQPWMTLHAGAQSIEAWLCWKMLTAADGIHANHCTHDCDVDREKAMFRTGERLHST